jgi:hypothetical protein
MYSTILLIHSWLRWLALAGGAGTTVTRSERWALPTMILLDVQMLLGLLMYLVLSPNIAEIRAHFGEAMKSDQLRFWAVEHITAMFIAVIVAHIGNVLARKAKTPESKRTRLMVCFGVATLLMLAGTPWPGLPYGRPLFRGL